MRLQQRDGVTCGPTVAIVGGALLDPDYGAQLSDAAWFDEEQQRVHRRISRIWPRALGTTPLGMAQKLTSHCASRQVRYRWRFAGGRRSGLRSGLLEVREALLLGWPVAMLIGGVIPRHWVLLVGVSDISSFRCYEPSSGEVLTVPAEAIRTAGLTGLGFPRPFGFVLPDRLARH